MPTFPPYSSDMSGSNSTLGPGPSDGVNAAGILSQNQRHIQQVLATTTSSLVILAAICALYWFCMMRRNFRRDIVLMLIVSDLWKAINFLTYSVVTFATRPIGTPDHYCQASGFIWLLATQMCGKMALRFTFALL